MNLGNLKTRVKAMLGRDDADDAPLVDYINIAVDRLSRLIKLPSLEVATTVPVTSGYITLPSDTSFVRFVYYGAEELQTTSQVDFLRYQQLSGDPIVYLQIGPKLYLGPVPADGTLIGLAYWRYETTLVNDGDTNSLAQVMGDAVAYGALYEAAVHFDDDRADRFEAEFQKRKGEVEEFAADFYASLVPQHQRSYFADTMEDY